MCFEESLPPQQRASRNLLVTYSFFHSNRYPADEAVGVLHGTQPEHLPMVSEAYDPTNPDAGALAYTTRLGAIYQRLLPEREENPEEIWPVLIDSAFYKDVIDYLTICHDSITDPVKDWIPYPALRLLKHFVREALPIKLDYRSWVAEIMILKVANQYEIDRALITIEPDITAATRPIPRPTYIGPRFDRDDGRSSFHLELEFVGIRKVLEMLAISVFHWVAIEAQVTGQPSFLEHPLREIPWHLASDSPQIYQPYASGVLGWRWLDLPWFSDF